MEMQIVAVVKVSVFVRDGETIEEVKDRLFDLLYEGLCNTANHQVDFEIESMEEI